MARTLRLTFDEYPDDEIVLRLAPVPVEDYFDIAERFDPERFRDLDHMRAMFRAFGDGGFIESWTFPEPVDGAGMLRRDFNLALQIVNQWLRGVGSVPLPLPVTASGGTLSTPEASPEP